MIKYKFIFKNSGNQLNAYNFNDLITLLKYN